MPNKTYRPWDPRKTYLFPPSMTDWLPEDHLVFTILDLVGELDISAIEDVIQDADPRGERPYSPRMMLALLMFAYCSGTFSSRAIVALTWRDVAFRVVSGDEHPHHATISRFRVDHGPAFQDLFVQVLKMCQRAGLVKLGHVAIDGTKIQANASKHRAMSYQRMKETEERLRKEVSELMARAGEADAAEDAAHGPDGTGDDLPSEIKRRKDRLERIRQAREELEAEAAAARHHELQEQAERAREAAKAASEPEDMARHERRAAARDAAVERLGADPSVLPGSCEGLPHHSPAHERDGTPKGDAQRNFTDPDSRIMTSGGGFVQAYNGQIAVDEENGIITAQLLTNQAPDNEHFQPVLEQSSQNTGNYPDQATADAGYWSEDNAHYCEQTGVDAHISPRRPKHAEGTGPTTEPVGPDLTRRDEMTRKLNTKEGRKVYARRKWVAEAPFGYIKEIRGFRRFSLRGLGKARSEWALICLTHNILKLHRAKMMD